LRRSRPEPAPAGLALEREGVFLSPERLANRTALGKGAAETTVLIVEDDPDQLALADLRVTMAGHRVRVARGCAELIEDLRARELPDLVLLDVMLSDGNGFDILAAMRSHPKLALLAVVMLTVLEDPDNIRHGLDLGADGYVVKPYSKAILAQAIRTVLKQIDPRRLA